MKKTIHLFSVAMAMSILTTTSLYAQEPETDPKMHAVKFSFWAPLTRSVSFGYEHYLKGATSLEISAGAIGLGVGHLIERDQEPAKGGYLEFGPKFFFTDPEKLKGLPRNGLFFMPHLDVSYFTANRSYENWYPYLDTSRYTARNLSIALLCSFGAQITLSRIVVLEAYVGAGYAKTLLTLSGDAPYDEWYTNEFNYKFSHLEASEDFPLALKAGFKVGLMLR